MKYVKENLETEIRDATDVLVVGGGVAGVAAAIAARRQGKDVIILEKTALFGGLATNGLISWYEPLCDGEGTQLMKGLAEELLRLSIKYGPNTLPEIWQDNGNPEERKKAVSEIKHPVYGRFATQYSPTKFQLALDELLQKEGVRIHLCISGVRPLMEENNRCSGVVTESVSGRQAFLAREVIDATGDASILFRAGVPCVNGRNYFTFIAQELKNEKAQDVLGFRKWHGIGSDLHGNGHPADIPHYAGVTNEEETAYLLKGRKMLLDEIRNMDGFQTDVTVLPSQAQFRKTRRLSGAYTMTENDLKRHQPRSVGLLCDFEKAGDWYELPFECLYHPEYPNLLAAGRMISADGWAWDVTRVIPGCAASGEAAGIAAAMAADMEKPLKELPVDALQRRIREQNNYLYRTEAGQ